MAIPIKATLKVSSKAFTTGIKVAGKAVGGLVAVAKLATVAVLGLTTAFVALTARQAALIDRIGKVSKVTGVGAETLQKFSFAAEQAGVGTDQAQVALRRFARRLGEAQKGAGELLPALKKLGIDVRNADGSFKSAEEVLFEFADGIANTDDATQRLALAFKAFDSEGAELVNTLMGGAAGLQEMFTRAQALGAVLSTSAIQGVEDFNDAFNELQTLTNGIANAFTAALAPALEKVVEDFTDFILTVAENQGGFDNFANFLKNEFLDIVTSIVKIFTQLGNILIETANTVARFARGVGASGLPELTDEGKKAQEQLKILKKVLEDAPNINIFTGMGDNRIGQFTKFVKELDSGVPILKELQDAYLRLMATMAGKPPKVQESMKVFFEGLFDDLVQGDTTLFGGIRELEKMLNIMDPFNTDEITNYIQSLKSVGTTSVEKVKEFKVATTETNRELDLTLGYFERIILQIGDFFTRDFPQKIKETIELLKTIFKTVQERLLEMTNPIKTIEDGLVKAGKAFEDALVDAILTGKSSFEDFRNILRETFARAIVQKFITEPIFGLFKAKGGPVSSGQPYIVGEKGPELFMPGASGTIIPNNNLQGSGGAGGGSVTYNINAVDAVSFKALVARDPEFIYNVTRAGARRVPG